ALFVIMFIWQTPHFLSLAMRRCEEYKEAGIPMLPAVHGFDMTKRQITIYIICLLPLPFFMISLGTTFVIIATILNVIWLIMAISGFFMKNDLKWAKMIFVYSLNYLTIMFIMMVVITIIPILFNVVLNILYIYKENKEKERYEYMKGWMGKIRALFVLGSLALFLSACGKENLTALVPKGYGAQESMDLIILTTIVMTSVFLVVVIWLSLVLIKFRRMKGQEEYIPKQVEGSQKLETIWTVIPIILVIIMAVPTLISTFDLADASDADEHINIDVVGKQYWWHFDYQDEEIQTSQDLYIPAGEKVYLNLLGGDITHSFWVPSLSGKLDANPENVNT